MRYKLFPSLRQRIGTKLEVQDLGLCPFAAFDVERSPVAEGRPQTFALPAGLWIVDAPIHPFGVKTHGIGHAKSDEFPVHHGQQRVIKIAGGDRHVFTQAKGVELIHPGVIARLGAVLSRGGRSVEDLAFTTIETSEMTAGQRYPRDSVAVDVHPADAVSVVLDWHFVV